MFIIQSYEAAVFCCIVTMLCWGSWPSLQKMNKRPWAFQYFYWDYIIGILVISIFLALTLGSYGQYGRSFIKDLVQADSFYLLLTSLGAVIWNLGNICIFIAIQIAGMAVAFPIAIGLSVLLGIVLNHIVDPVAQNVWLLFSGMGCILVAIIFDALAYRAIETKKRGSHLTRGFLTSVVAGVLLGLFYLFIAKAMTTNFLFPEAGKLTPYTAFFIFAIMSFVSNLLFNTWIMKKPISGVKLDYSGYFCSNALSHGYGLLAGIISGLGTYFSLIAFGVAGAAISFGLGQGSTMVAALWGLLIWKEFKGASKYAYNSIFLMFMLYIIGLCLITSSKL